MATFEVDDSRLGNWMLESWVKEVGEGIETEADRSLNMLDMVVVVQQREVGYWGRGCKSSSQKKDSGSPAKNRTFRLVPRKIGPFIQAFFIRLITAQRGKIR